MPNRKAKDRKEKRRKLNEKWAREGRTANQHKKYKAKLTVKYPFGNCNYNAKIWQNGECPLINSMDFTEMPSDSIGNNRKLIPSCLGASASVRTKQKIQSAF